MVKNSSTICQDSKETLKRRVISKTSPIPELFCLRSTIKQFHVFWRFSNFVSWETKNCIGATEIPQKGSESTIQKLNGDYFDTLWGEWPKNDAAAATFRSSVFNIGGFSMVTWMTHPKNSSTKSSMRCFKLSMQSDCNVAKPRKRPWNISQLGFGDVQGYVPRIGMSSSFLTQTSQCHKTLNWKPRKASPIHSLFPFPKVPASSFKVNLQTQAGSILSEYHKEVPAPSSHFRKFTWMNTNETANKRIKCYRNFYVFYHFNAFRSKRPEPL